MFKWIQYGTLISLLSLIGFLYFQKTSLERDVAKKETAIVQKTSLIEKLNIQIGSYETVRDADERTIKSLQEQLKMQGDFDTAIGTINTSLTKGLKDVRAGLKIEIPEAAQSADCGIDKRLLVDPIRASTLSGVSASRVLLGPDVDGGELSGRLD